MGTSSIYNGPKKSPLLPKDFEEQNNPDSDDNKENVEQKNKGKEEPNVTDTKKYSENDVTWGGAKRTISRYASGNSQNYKKGISNYIKASGGAGNAARTAKSGIQSTANLGRFLSNAHFNGFDETFREANISFEGKSAKEIINEIINFLAPVPTTKEEAVARKAIISSMEWLYQRFEEEGKDITSIDKIDKETFNLIIPIQFENYIYEKIISDLGSRFEEKASSPNDVVKKEEEIRNYIVSKVETTFKDIDFTLTKFNDKYISKEVENLYQKCYKVMEDML